MNKGRGEHFQKFAKNSREKFPSFWGSGEEFDEIQLRVSWGEKLLNVKRNITQLKGFTHKNGKKIAIKILNVHTNKGAKLFRIIPKHWYDIIWVTSTRSSMHLVTG